MVVGLDKNSLAGITGDGLADSSTERRCGGRYASAYEYAEQLVTVIATTMPDDDTAAGAASSNLTEVGRT